jgi:hypothetical protein
MLQTQQFEIYPPEKKTNKKNQSGHTKKMMTILPFYNYKHLNSLKIPIKIKHHGHGGVRRATLPCLNRNQIPI